MQEHKTVSFKEDYISYAAGILQRKHEPHSSLHSHMRPLCWGARGLKQDDVLWKVFKQFA